MKRFIVTIDVDDFCEPTQIKAEEVGDIVNFYLDVDSAMDPRDLVTCKAHVVSCEQLGA